MQEQQQHHRGCVDDRHHQCCTMRGEKGMAQRERKVRAGGGGERWGTYSRKRWCRHRDDKSKDRENVNGAFAV